MTVREPRHSSRIAWSWGTDLQSVPHFGDGRARLADDAGEVAPLHEGEMGADRPVVFRGRRSDLDPRNAAGMDARAGIVIDGIGLVLPADAPRADARLQEAALREGKVRFPQTLR